MTADDARWAAVVARDPGADGTFYYSVETTGVYCRPSCGARRALRRHVRFHRTAAGAERAGFRACRRCAPDRPALWRLRGTRIARVCRRLERAGTMPTLAQLAAIAGLSAYHFHRVFKASTGLTPRAYAAAHRAKRVQAELKRKDKTVTEAIYDAGFNSGGRFYETSRQLLGMTPTDYRGGATGIDIHFAAGECSLGSILVARTERGICAILLGDDSRALLRDLHDRFPHATLVGSDPAFERTLAGVIAFVEAPRGGLDLPLDVRGTAFERRVWQALQEIPPGATASYTDIAKRIGAPKGARAVARACAANPVAVAIPCHRVLRTDGTLSGYRWGIERKRRLLEREHEQQG